jgi:hypothetical protein
MDAMLARGPPLLQLHQCQHVSLAIQVRGQLRRPSVATIVPKDIEVHIVSQQYQQLRQH